jgi:hypothetical protein
MISPGRYDIRADRWVACIRTFTFVGKDFTGASYLSHIRLTKDDSGAPLVTLADAAAGAEGLHLIGVFTATVQAHIDAGRLDVVPPGYTLTDTVTLSQVSFRVNETSMETLPFPGERGNDATLQWDLHITPSGGIKDKYVGGDFVVRAGATQ